MSSSEVDTWFENYDNPQKEVMQRVREFILAADEQAGSRVRDPAPEHRSAEDDVGHDVEELGWWHCRQLPLLGARMWASQPCLIV